MTTTTRSPCTSGGGALLAGDRFCGSCGTATGPGAPGTTRQTPATGVAAAAVVATTQYTNVDTSPWGAVAARLQSATLGEFEIVTELGRGGMAAVYLARDLALNRRVAIKVMAPGLLLGPGMIERFRQEAVTVANLQHAHIVSIHAVRQLEDLHFFVMQFVPGRTLEGVLRESTSLSIAAVRAWLYQIGSALGYAHRRGVIHRDVKPGNILLNADGEAVVTDFGIAKVAESPSHTQTGTVVGTPVYMSPEQCYARELTGASDQYSLGVVAYEMLAGRPPFSGSSFALMRAHTDEAPPPLTAARPDVPPSMDAALMRMLAKSPEDRFPTLAEALVALGAAPLGPEDELHSELRQLAAVTERLDQLADVLRTPVSPVPKTRERPRAATATPNAGVPNTEAMVVVIAPPPSDLAPGATAALRATMRNGAGQAVQGSQLVWTSSAPNVVSVDENGVLTAISAGQATISARAGVAQDTVDVVIGARTVKAPAGAAAPSVASPVAAPRRQARIPTASSGYAWKWAVPVVAAAGIAAYFVLRPERSSQQASSSEPSAVPVSTARDSTAPTAPSTPAVVQDSAPPTTAAPTTAVTPNDSTDAPRRDSATSVATRTAPAVSRLELRPAKAAAIAPGETVTLAAIARDASGKAVNDARLTWSSSDTRVATIDAARGTVRGVGAGATRIPARADDATAAVMISVVPPAPERAVAATPAIPEARPPANPTKPEVATPSPAPAASSAKTEAELRAEVQAVIATYARAIETRDTSLIRRVFPTTGNELMTRWQTTFDDARGNIQMSGGAVELTDTPRDVAGSQVHARARYNARFSSRAARSVQSFPVAFTAVLQRDGASWRIVSIK
jgi:serine/threonine-protein kinase